MTLHSRRLNDVISLTKPDDCVNPMIGFLYRRTDKRWSYGSLFARDVVIVEYVAVDFAYLHLSEACFSQQFQRLMFTPGRA